MRDIKETAICTLPRKKETPEKMKSNMSAVHTVAFITLGHVMFCGQRKFSYDGVSEFGYDSILITLAF